jgi:hypothetical protein
MSYVVLSQAKYFVQNIENQNPTCTKSLNTSIFMTTTVLVELVIDNMATAAEVIVYY